MRSNRLLLAFGIFGILVLTVYLFYLSNQPQPTKISIKQAWARPAQSQQTMKPESSHNTGHSEPSPTTSAVYLTIRNTSETTDYLIAIESDIAKRIELHQTLQNGDIMQMQPIHALEIPAKSQVILAPGSYHIMLIDLTRELKVGDRFNITLVFEKNGQIPVSVDVRQP